MKRVHFIILFAFLMFSAKSSFSQNVMFTLAADQSESDPYYGLKGEYLDIEELCVNLRGRTSNDMPFETDVFYRIERLTSSNSKYEIAGGIFVKKFDFSKSSIRSVCLTESGTYRLTLYQQYENAIQVRNFTEFVIHSEDFVVNIKGKPQEKVLTRASGSSYYEIATLYLYEIKDGTPKDSYDWTFRLKDGVAMINFVVRMNDPLKLSEIKAVITRYDSKVSSKGVSIENEREYKRISFTVPSRDWNAVSANFSIEDKDHYIMDLFTQDDQFIERVAFIVK
ncbi:MAG: hypothetical protein MUE75_01280 [Algoriphagus sp.]|jgi:hypothetical protein|nr:hypothetical protein [Algoriphagus sp.]